jgi:hypothetical protein
MKREMNKKRELRRHYLILISFYVKQIFHLHYLPLRACFDRIILGDDTLLNIMK